MLLPPVNTLNNVTFHLFILAWMKRNSSPIANSAPYWSLIWSHQTTRFCCHYIISAGWRILKTLVTFCRCVPIFKVAELLKNLSMAHGLTSKGSLNYVLSFSSRFIKFCTKFNTYAFFCDVRHHKYNAWHKHQWLCGCIEILLLEDVQEHVKMCRKVWSQCDATYWRNEQSGYVLISTLITQAVECWL